MKRLLLVLFLLPIAVMAQTEAGHQGIQWTSKLTWQQVKEKAKKENKYIFVDCYATWCKPCAAMDKEVYTVDSVGDYLNKEFIPVKVQIDQTRNDDAATKSWYKTASYINKEYNLTAYPTILFFTPGGEIATKEVGYKDPGSLITIARNSKDPSKQYYVLLNNYKKGKLNDAAKRSLINTAKQLGDTVNFHTLRNNYFAYLHTLPKHKLYTKENIEFIATIISKRSQPVFDMFYPDGSAVDKVMGKNGYAKKVVDDVIMKEKIATPFNAAIDAKQDPDWNSIYNSIAKDYNADYADRNIMEAKIKWYWSVENNAMKTAITLNDKMEKYGSDTTKQGEDFALNNWAFLLWKSIGATAKPNQEAITELTRISKWMEGVARRGEKATGYYRTDYWHMYMDTYANLLHKIGRKSEAIKWEELALSKAKEFGAGNSDIEEYEDRLDKIRKNEATWPVAEK